MLNFKVKIFEEKEIKNSKTIENFTTPLTQKNETFSLDQDSATIAAKIIDTNILSRKKGGDSAS